MLSEAGKGIEAVPRVFARRLFGVGVVVVDRAGSSLLEHLAASLPPSGAGAGPALEVRYTVNHAGPAGSGLSVWRDGEPGLAGVTADEAARWLLADIDGTVARRSPAGLFVHAGVVGWRGRAILVPGRSMTGKSTLVAALVRQGADYYSDEYAVVDDEGRIHPYARAPVLRGAHDPTRRAPAARAEPRDPLPAALAVCTSYHPGARGQPEVIRGARAALCLMDNTVLARSEPGRTLRLAARLGAGIIALKGPRPEADEVAPRLLEWIDALEEGRESPGGGDEQPQARRVAWTATRLGRPAARIRPARHVRVTGLLSPEEHQQLLDHALAHESGFVTSGMLVDGTPGVDLTYRSSRTNPGIGPAADLLKRRLRPLLPHVRRELEIPWFPMGRVEYQLTVHHGGDFFKVHCDGVHGTLTGRRITCVYYFHTEPRGFSGGELRLHETRDEAGRIESTGHHVDVEPADNTAVFFSSDLLHEVRPIRTASADFRDGRFSINVFFWSGPPPQWAGDPPSRLPLA